MGLSSTTVRTVELVQSDLWEMLLTCDDGGGTVPVDTGRGGGQASDLADPESG